MSEMEHIKLILSASKALEQENKKLTITEDDVRSLDAALILGILELVFADVLPKPFGQSGPGGVGLCRLLRPARRRVALVY
jgi:hypothetical protein